ncbi:hypothetical protein GCM10009805_30090 [Leucobacter chromiireducens subsp. solipictus]
MQLTEAQTWAALGMLTATVLGMLTFSTRTMTRTMTFLVDGIRGALDGLRGEMDGLRGVVEGLGQRIDRIGEEFRRENDEFRSEIRRENDGLRSEIRRELDGVREEITALREADSLTRTRITELHDATVQLRGDVNTLTHRVTFLEQSMTEGFASVERRFAQIGG